MVAMSLTSLERDLDLAFLPTVEGRKHLQVGPVWVAICKTSRKSASKPILFTDVHTEAQRQEVVMQRVAAEAGSHLQADGRCLWYKCTPPLVSDASLGLGL